MSLGWGSRVPRTELPTGQGIFRNPPSVWPCCCWKLKSLVPSFLWHGEVPCVHCSDPACPFNLPPGLPSSSSRHLPGLSSPSGQEEEAFLSHLVSGTSNPGVRRAVQEGVTSIWHDAPTPLPPPAFVSLKLSLICFMW